LQDRKIGKCVFFGIKIVFLQDAGPWPSRGHPEKQAPDARYEPATYKTFPTNTGPDPGGLFLGSTFGENIPG